MLERSGAGASESSVRGTDGFPCRAFRQRECPLRTSHPPQGALGAQHVSATPAAAPQSGGGAETAVPLLQAEARPLARSSRSVCAADSPLSPFPELAPAGFPPLFDFWSVRVRGAHPAQPPEGCAELPVAPSAASPERGAGAAPRLRDAQQLPVGQALPGNFQCNEETQRFSLPGVFAEQGVSLIIVFISFVCLFVFLIVFFSGMCPLLCAGELLPNEKYNELQPWDIVLVLKRLSLSWYLFSFFFFFPFQGH